VESDAELRGALQEVGWHFGNKTGQVRARAVHSVAYSSPAHIVLVCTPMCPARLSVPCHSVDGERRGPCTCLQDWPVDIMLLSNTSLLAAAAVSATHGTSTSSASSMNSSANTNTTISPVVLPGMTMLTGPFNHVPASAKTVTLDLGHVSSPLLALPPYDARTPGEVARLVVSKVVLTGLASAPLAPLLPDGADAGSGAYTSALPLWAVDMQARWVWVHGRGAAGVACVRTVWARPQQRTLLWAASR
jgi:hypothetical protein